MNEKAVCSPFDKDKFIDDVKETNWSCDGQNSNISCELFLNKLNTLVDTHVPYKTISKKQRKQIEKPWITKGILSSIKH